MLILDFLINNYSICEYESFTFWYLHLLFIFLALSHWLGLPGQCWMDKLVFFSFSLFRCTCTSWDMGILRRNKWFFTKRTRIGSCSKVKEDLCWFGMTSWNFSDDWDKDGDEASQAYFERLYLFWKKCWYF